MEFENSFNVAVPVDEAWAILTDIERIAPCMPGAELTEIVDENSFRGKVSVRLGPVALTFQGDAKFEERDDSGHSARVKAQGRDAKGRGGANANVDFRLVPADDGTTEVQIRTDLQLSGSVAQYGRGVGMIKDVAGQLIGRFAAALHEQIAAERGADEAAAETPEETAEPAPSPAAKPISGFSLGASVMWNAVLRWLKGLFGARSGA
ncbi:MAG: SRPBCC family protein [Defluviicoccus sp.]|nr:SRPBCC family protein [Defluviicoccus sp.]MDE0383126.1 SRPBCC family protein [Defluviicoccus sp.]